MLQGDIQDPKWATIKVMLLGAFQTGKSSTLQSLIQGKFNPDRPTTLGVEFESLLLNNMSIEEKTCKFHVWDTAGQTTFREIVQKFFRGTQIFLLFVDANNQASIDSIEMYIKDICRLATVEKLNIILVLSKQDLVDISEEAIGMMRQRIKTNLTPNAKLHATCFVSAKTLFGLEDLRAALKSAAANILGLVSSASYHKLTDHQDPVVGINNLFTDYKDSYVFHWRHHRSKAEEIVNFIANSQPEDKKIIRAFLESTMEKCELEVDFDRTGSFARRARYALSLLEDVEQKAEIEFDFLDNQPRPT